MKKVSNREVLKFLGYLKKLEVVEALGVARLLSVDVTVRADGEDADTQSAATITEKEYDIILSEMIDAYINIEKSKRKFILNIMKEATYDVKEEK
jgi:hypothetical protein